MDTTARSLRPTRWDLICWELCWTPVEMAGVALGLFIGLGFDNWTVGNFVLIAVLALSYVVRFQHYSKLPSRDGGAEPGAAADRGRM